MLLLGFSVFGKDERERKNAIKTTQQQPQQTRTVHLERSGQGLGLLRRGGMGDEGARGGVGAKVDDGVVQGPHARHHLHARALPPQLGGPFRPAIQHVADPRNEPVLELGRRSARALGLEAPHERLPQPHPRFRQRRERQRAGAAVHAGAAGRGCCRLLFCFGFLLHQGQAGQRQLPFLHVGHSHPRHALPAGPVPAAGEAHGRGLGVAVGAQLRLAGSHRLQHPGQTGPALLPVAALGVGQRQVVGLEERGQRVRGRLEEGVHHGPDIPPVPLQQREGGGRVRVQRRRHRLRPAAHEAEGMGELLMVLLLVLRRAATRRNPRRRPLPARLRGTAGARRRCHQGHQRQRGAGGSIAVLQLAPLLPLPLSLGRGGRRG